MTDLVQRLREAIDETERIAQGALSHPTRFDYVTREHVRIEDDDGVWSADRCVVESDSIRIYDEGGHDEGQAEHIARHDPAAVLRRCAADRKILDLHQPTPRYAGNGLGCSTCLSDRQGYPEDWNPDWWPCVTVQAVAEGYGIET